MALDIFKHFGVITNADFSVCSIFCLWEKHLIWDQPCEQNLKHTAFFVISLYDAFKHIDLKIYDSGTYLFIYSLISLYCCEAHFVFISHINNFLASQGRPNKFGSLIETSRTSPEQPAQLVSRVVPTGVWRGISSSLGFGGNFTLLSLFSDAFGSRIVSQIPIFLILALAEMIDSSIFWHVWYFLYLDSRSRCCSKRPGIYL